jgi:hypothetical protein
MFDVEKSNANIIRRNTRRWFRVERGPVFFLKNWSRIIPKLVRSKDIEIMFVHIFSKYSDNEWSWPWVIFGFVI